MADRPILFSGPMVRALLAGTKMQTRRILNPQPNMLNGGQPLNNGRGSYSTEKGWKRYRIAAGDRLYVREAWRVSNEYDEVAPRDLNHKTRVHFEADPSMPDRLIDIDAMTGKFRQGMHMPRWASRLTLMVSDVRVQRLQDISRDDAIAEGLSLASNRIEEFWRWPEPMHKQLWLSPVAAYRALWDSLNADRGFGWDVNSWVVAVTFSVEHRNIDREPPHA